MTSFKSKNILYFNSFRAWNKQEFIREQTNMRCMVCKEMFPVEIFAFHHLDPSTKKFNLNSMKWRGVRSPSQKTLDEAKKCAILCHNCHALEHVALKNGETLIDDPEAYSRYRNHRVTKPFCEESVDDRDEGLPERYEEELQLPTPTD